MPHKKTTIRAKRKRPIKKGDELYLYTGMRTAYCEKLADAICTSVRDIRITDKLIIINGVELTPSQESQVAINDGFETVAEMRQFFEKTHSLPFNGDIISWKLTEVFL